MNKFTVQLILCLVLCLLPHIAFSKQIVVEIKTQTIIAEIIKTSYPELKSVKINVRTFESPANYFQSQFSLTRFLTCQKLHYNIYVNPEAFNKNAPEEAIRAIIAHELAHVLYYSERNRLELIGLVNLIDKGFTTKFERRADLEAIARGYGDGLIKYRQWLYQNIPAKKLSEKKRNYFSPEEIEKMLEIIKQKPVMIDVWKKKVPRNLNEISDKP